MEKDERLQKYDYEEYTVVTNFETYDDVMAYAQEQNGEVVEVGFTDGSDNPMPNADGNLMAEGRTFKVGLGEEYKVYYAEDEGFQKMAEDMLETLKKKEDDDTPEDWLADQNIAAGDRIIIVKNGEVNTITTRERIKFLMRGSLYELAVKVPKTTS